MEGLFLGIDVGGGQATHMTVLREINSSLPPILDSSAYVSIQDIKNYVGDLGNLTNERHIVALTLDAQLSFDTSRENGFRAADYRLKELTTIPGNAVQTKKNQNRILSSNSAMAIIPRSQQILHIVGPFIGTILETHPFVSMCQIHSAHFTRDDVYVYKNAGHADSRQRIYNGLIKDHVQYALQEESNVPDDVIDSLVCALVGYWYHRRPELVQRLPYDVVNEIGHAPLYVAATSESRIFG